MNDTEILIQALAEMWTDLPPLADDEWETFEAALLIRLRAIEGAQLFEREDEFDRLLEFLDRFPAVRERLLQTYSFRAQQVQRGAVRVPPKISGSIKYQRYLEIPIFYATDREAAADVHTEPFFTGERGLGQLSYGVVRVSVPDDHRSGEIEKPIWWKLQFRQDPECHVVVLGVEPANRQAFIARASATLARGVVPEALVFVHGYNVSFVEAARRAAQIAYDLQFQGLTMLYSWASEGATLQYLVDRTNALWSPPRFREFLTLALTELGATSVHAIAHSMGNEVLANGLAAFDSAGLPPGSAQLNEIILAAPDVDTGTFRDLAARFAGRARRFTLYASANDKALGISQGVQKYPRAGQAGEDLTIIVGVETIDASEVDTGLVGHSYIGDNNTILTDVSRLVRKHEPPEERGGMAAVDRDDGRYWMFVPTRK